MGKPLVYLAGAMEKAGEYGHIWREEITPHLEFLGYEIWNPYKEEMNVGINVEELSTLKHTNFDAYEKFCQKIVDYDIKHLLKCDLVVCRLDWAVQMGAGTYGELTVCRVNDIPVYAWVDREKNEYDLPGWVVGCLTAYTSTKNRHYFYTIIPTPKELNELKR